MSKKTAFLEAVREGYQFSGESIILGGAMYDGRCIADTFVRLPLKTLNRHGLIAGATGTGKTKTLQVIIEQLSARGVPSLVMDIKGDLSGVATRGESNARIEERHGQIGLPFIPDASPVEFLTLSDEKGCRLRATISEFGPVLFSKILGLNEIQEGIVSVLFKYCDDRNYPLLDMRDFRKVLQYAGSAGKEEIEAEYGRISPASVGAIMRRIVEMEHQGGDRFFGERSFDPADLMRVDDQGRGVINILRLIDIQDRPKLFSTFMLQLLAEIYATFPEIGDPAKPKLTLFIEEAHLVFTEATRALLNQIEVIVRLIRSKGVGVFFITQNPQDIPDAVLSQLGLKIQHSLRAFTAKDRRNIRLVSENYPVTEFYQIDQLITQLGTGEALVSALNERGIPTPLVHTLLRAPQSRMDILTSEEIDEIISGSALVRKYNEVIDRESAYEILGGKIDEIRAQEDGQQTGRQPGRATTMQRPAPTRRTSRRQPKSVWESTTTRQITNTVARELTRGLLGVLGVQAAARRRRKKTTFPW